ncbi:hypothetical protein VP01_3457g1 [Puccinia sorghi]|uniref:Uncharacterized protein n=1 Tax=Puccinia sorghi TaxID=27349 RepID=A0A0L6UW37_9BASI|nr:hypothetical protein VP01_3457g1 [Puccinia sorghi]
MPPITLLSLPIQDLGEFLVSRTTKRHTLNLLLSPLETLKPPNSCLLLLSSTKSTENIFIFLLRYLLFIYTILSAPQGSTPPAEPICFFLIYKGFTALSSQMNGFYFQTCKSGSHWFLIQQAAFPAAITPCRIGTCLEGSNPVQGTHFQQLMNVEIFSFKFPNSDFLERTIEFEDYKLYMLSTTESGDQINVRMKMLHCFHISLQRIFHEFWNIWLEVLVLVWIKVYKISTKAAPPFKNVRGIIPKQITIFINLWLLKSFKLIYDEYANRLIQVSQKPLSLQKKLSQLPGVDMQHAPAKLPSKLHLFSYVDVLAKSLILSTRRRYLPIKQYLYHKLQLPKSLRTKLSIFVVFPNWNTCKLDLSITWDKATYNCP